MSLPNQRIHADLFGPLKTSEKGKKFILVITDAFTKYIELVALENKEASTVTDAIFNNWLCRFGIPAELVTDQGKEFTANLCKLLWEKLDVIHSTTSPRHPQCNSQAEVANKTIAKYLAAFVDEQTLDWEQYLPALMFSYNTSFHRAIKTSPFFLTYGIEPNLPGELPINYADNSSTDLLARLKLARHLASKNIEKAGDASKTYYDTKVKTYIFQANQQVLLDEHYFLDRNQKLSPKYTGPHLITKLKGNCNVELLLDNGKFAIVHVNRLKPYFSHVNDGQNFSKQGRGIDDTGSVQKMKHDTVIIDKPQDLEQEHKVTQKDREETDQETASDQYRTPPDSPGGDRDRYATRRATKEQGLVYNKETCRFEPQSTSDTVEALTRRFRKKLIQSRTERRENFFIVEHVFGYEQVQPQMTETSYELGEETEEDLPAYPIPHKMEKEIKIEPPDPETDNPMDTQPAPTQHIVFYPTPTKTISFNPQVKRREFHTPNLEETKRTKKPEPSTSFAKEVLKSTAEALFPKVKPEYPSPDSRPIRGATKSFAELFPDSPVKPEPTAPEMNAKTRNQSHHRVRPTRIHHDHVGHSLGIPNYPHLVDPDPES